MDNFNRLRSIKETTKLPDALFVKLLSCSEAELEIIITNLDNENVKAIISFYHRLRIRNVKNYFEKLELHNFDKLVIHKILNAPNLEVAYQISSLFSYSIEKFKTIEEWLTYLDYLSENRYSTLEDLDYILGNVSTNRVGEIKKVMSLKKDSSKS